MHPTLTLPTARRQWLALMALGIFATGCTTDRVGANTADVDQQRRLRGIGLVLVVDAVPGVELAGVVFYDERGYSLFASSIVARRNRGILALGGTRVPVTVRVVWRDHPKPVWGRNGGIDYEGPIIGDHTVPVATRIPDEVLRDIRAKPGSLRLARWRAVRLGHRARRRRLLALRQPGRGFSGNAVLICAQRTSHAIQSDFLSSAPPVAGADGLVHRQHRVHHRYGCCECTGRGSATAIPRDRSGAGGGRSAAGADGRCHLPRRTRSADLCLRGCRQAQPRNHGHGRYPHTRNGAGGVAKGRHPRLRLRRLVRRHGPR